MDTAPFYSDEVEAKIFARDGLRSFVYHWPGKRIMHLLFDLDGTLTDPFPGITRCIQHALVSLGHPSPVAESLGWCIGPSLKQSFATLLGPQDAHRADAALARYRERFSTVGLFENSVYPEIKSALNEFNSCGHNLSVATSKPGIFAERIIDHFGLKKYFRSVDGSELDRDYILPKCKCEPVRKATETSRNFTFSALASLGRTSWQILRMEAAAWLTCAVSPLQNSVHSI